MTYKKYMNNEEAPEEVPFFDDPRAYTYKKGPTKEAQQAAKANLARWKEKKEKEGFKGPPDAPPPPPKPRHLIKSEGGSGRW